MVTETETETGGGVEDAAIYIVRRGEDGHDYR